MHSPLQSAPAKEDDLQSTNPVGILEIQFLVSCVEEEKQMKRVSQMGFRLLTVPVLVSESERESERESE